MVLGVPILKHFKVLSILLSFGCMKIWGAIFVTLMVAWASHKVLRLSLFNVMGKALLGKLSCMRTGPEVIKKNHAQLR